MSSVAGCPPGARGRAKHGDGTDCPRRSRTDRSDAAADGGDRHHRLAAAAAAARARRARPLPGPRAPPARRPAGQRADHARRPRRALRPLPAAAGAARGRHRDPPGGDDPRPAPAPDRGAERPGDRAPAAGGRASGVERFVFFSALNASAAQRTRFFRAKWLAEQAVDSSPLETTIFAPSIVYDHSDPWITLLRRLSFLPVLPVSGDGKSAFQPIWADDVARCVVAALDGGEPARATSWPGRRR